METERCIDIFASDSTVRAFLLEVRNLPKWTTFFKTFLGYEQNIAIMETPIGKCSTYCQEIVHKNEIEIIINSQFETKKENASISIKNFKDYCRIKFRLNLPDSMSPIAKTKMLCVLEEELIVLKRLMETDHG